MASFTSDEKSSFVSKTWIGGSLNRVNQDKICKISLNNDIDILMLADGHGMLLTCHNQVIDIGGMIANNSNDFLIKKIKEEYERNSDLFNGNDYLTYFNIIFEELHNHVREQVCQYLVISGCSTRIVTEMGGTKFLNGGFIEYHWNDEPIPVWKSLVGGTTITMIIILKNKIISVQLGDSPAFLFIDKDTLGGKRFNKIADLKSDIVISELIPTNQFSLTEDDTIPYVNLTPEDHSPTNYDDYSYMNLIAVNNNLPKLLFLQNKGMLQTQVLLYSPSGELLPIPEGSHVKNKDGERHSMITTRLCNRINPPQSISMTRSIGDFTLGALGLIHKPTIYELNIEELDYNKLTIVLMSDGVSDCYKKKQLLTLLETVLNEVDCDIEKYIGTFMEQHMEVAKRLFGNNSDNSTIGFYQITKSLETTSSNSVSN